MPIVTIQLLPRFLLSGLYFLGLLFSLYLFGLYFRIDSVSLCALFGSDCIGVALSEYGTVAGFPVATFSLGYFAFQLVLTLACLRNEQSISRLLGLLLNMLAGGGSLYFMYIMISVLQESCIVCYGVHTINLLTLGVHIRGYYRNRTVSPPLVVSSSFRANMQAAYPCFQAAVLVALLVIAASNLLLSRHQLTLERTKVSDNLQYQQYLYQSSVVHEFAVESTDQVIGEEEAVHQIVLIYKNTCRSCKIAKKELSQVVKQNSAAVYLIMKNHQDLPVERLKELGVEHVPAVFINGRRALGWDMPGFLDQFTEDCGC